MSPGGLLSEGSKSEEEVSFGLEKTELKFISGIVEEAAGRALPLFPSLDGARICASVQLSQGESSGAKGDATGRDETEVLAVEGREAKAVVAREAPECEDVDSRRMSPNECTREGFSSAVGSFSSPSEQSEVPLEDPLYVARAVSCRQVLTRIFHPP